MYSHIVIKTKHTHTHTHAYIRRCSQRGLLMHKLPCCSIAPSCLFSTLIFTLSFFKEHTLNPCKGFPSHLMLQLINGKENLCTRNKLEQKLPLSFTSLRPSAPTIFSMFLIGFTPKHIILQYLCRSF